MEHLSALIRIAACIGVWKAQAMFWIECYLPVLAAYHKFAHKCMQRQLQLLPAGLMGSISLNYKNHQALECS